MRMWGAWRASAKPACDPGPEPASLGPSLTCHLHHTPGASPLPPPSWLQARGLGRQAGVLWRPDQDFFAGWAGCPGSGGGHKVEPAVPLSLQSPPPAELMSATEPLTLSPSLYLALSGSFSETGGGGSHGEWGEWESSLSLRHLVNMGRCQGGPHPYPGTMLILPLPSCMLHFAHEDNF